MSQSYRFTCLLAMMISCAVILFSGSAYADKVDFAKCASNPDHHCYSFSPQLNQVPPGASVNWSFDIFMPTNACNISGVMDNQGNCSVSSLTVSDDNYTRTKQNVGVESVQHIHTVASNPTVNYCPLGLFTLKNQDGYLYKIYNNATSLDLTGYMYPDTCIIESGPNPINGHHITVVPEFQTSLEIIIIPIGFVILISTWFMKFTGKTKL